MKMRAILTLALIASLAMQMQTVRDWVQPWITRARMSACQDLEQRSCVMGCARVCMDFSVIAEDLRNPFNQNQWRIYAQKCNDCNATCEGS